jgi:hypothetical protein
LGQIEKYLVADSIEEGWKKRTKMLLFCYRQGSRSFTSRVLDNPKAFTISQHYHNTARRQIINKRYIIISLKYNICNTKEKHERSHLHVEYTGI